MMIVECEQYIEAAGVAGAADGAAEARPFETISAPENEKYFRNDACVPRAAPKAVTMAGDEIRKKMGRQDEVGASDPKEAEAVDFARLSLRFSGNGHGAGDDVEEDVPLRARESIQGAWRQSQGPSAEAKQKREE